MDEPQNAEEAQQEYAEDLRTGQGDPLHHGDLMPAGRWEAYSSTGGHIVMDIPADKSDEHLTIIEEYREATGADPVTYILADVDNRQGAESINMYQVQVFDEDGNSYEFSGVSEYVSDISPSTDWDADDGTYILPDGTTMSREEGAELSSQSTELHNEHLHGASVAERKTLVLVYEGDDLPNEFTRVAVWPNGVFEEVDAYPVD